MSAAAVIAIWDLRTAATPNQLPRCAADLTDAADGEQLHITSGD